MIEDDEVNDADELDADDSQNGVNEKTMADRAKEVGRDGAYLELDADQLVAAYRSGELQKAKIVVIKAARIELSDPVDVEALQKLVSHVASCVTGIEGKTFDVTGMSDEQASFYSMRAMLSSGLRRMPK